MTPSQPLDTPFWTFSLAVYAGDGVADECLALQESLGLDVNILLFAVFIGALDGVMLKRRDFAALSAAVAAWQVDIVRPLRQVRRALKPMNTEGLRAQVKAAELEAEKIEQGLLWQWSRQLADRPRGDRAQALAANLYGLLEFYGGVGVQAYATAALPRLTAAAIAYQP